MEGENIMVKGKLTKLLVGVIIGCLAYMSMWFFYANMVTEYSGILDFEIDSSFNETYLLMNETLGVAGGDMTATGQDYINATGGTSLTASDSMILKSFGVVKSILSNSFGLIMKVTVDTASKLQVPGYWVTGFIAILLVIVIIAIVSGFFKITTW